MKLLRILVKLILLLSLLALVSSYFLKSRLPLKEDIDVSLYNNPVQEATILKELKINRDEYEYRIVPKYEYEIHGLVVSLYNSDSLLDIFHKDDPLNTKDLCVLWGNNLITDVYHKMKFEHGEFTCSFIFKSEVDSFWKPKFDMYQGSNNHMLPASESINRKLKQVSVGDQIHVRGYLADYYVEKSGYSMGQRMTSTARTDRGNGACEIIYVTDLEVVKKGNQIFHNIFTFSKYTFIIFLIVFLAIFITRNPMKD